MNQYLDLYVYSKLVPFGFTADGLTIACVCPGFRLFTTYRS